MEESKYARHAGKSPGVNVCVGGGVAEMVQGCCSGKKEEESRARGGILKLLWSPGIDSNESWRAGTTTQFLLGS